MSPPIFSRLPARSPGKSPVQLAIASKAQRGYFLVDGKEPEALKAAPVALTPDSTGEAAFRVIARACLRQLVANQPVLLRGDAEAVHQMRVAMRRLRAAISLFAGMLSDRQTAEMKAQLKSLSAELGPAREFDVFIRRVLTPVSQDKPAGTGIAVLAKDLQQKREEAFDRARSAVQSVRFRELMIDVSAWIETGDWTRNADDRASSLRVRPIAALAAAEVNRRWKRILKRGARLKRLDAQRRHKLRIQAKKLRYASEFFAGAFPGKKAKERRVDFLDGLEGLQDALGDLNDIAVHEELTAQIADTKEITGKRRAGRTKKAFAAGRLSGREEARAISVLKDAQHAYRGFARAKPYWL